MARRLKPLQALSAPYRARLRRQADKQGIRVQDLRRRSEALRKARGHDKPVQAIRYPNQAEQSGYTKRSLEVVERELRTRQGQRTEAESILRQQREAPDLPDVRYTTPPDSRLVLTFETLWEAQDADYWRHTAVQRLGMVHIVPQRLPNGELVWNVWVDKNTP